MRRSVPLLVVLAVVSGSGCAGGDALPGAPPGLVELLEVMPADALSRGLYYSHQARDDATEGFATALPLGKDVCDDLGFCVPEAEQVLESGAVPAVLLRGTFDLDAIDEALTARGYVREEPAGGWRRFAAPDAATDALTVGLPAVAARPGFVFLGTAGDVERVVESSRPAATVGWPVRLAEALGGDVTFAALGTPGIGVDRAARLAGTDTGGVLASAGVASPLASYDGFAVGGGAGGGVIAASYHGDDGHEFASDFAVRVATAPVLGEPTRRFGDGLAPRSPRWVESANVARVPTARAPDPALLRRQLEEGRLLFLVPSRG